MNNAQKKSPIGWILGACGCLTALVVLLVIIGGVVFFTMQNSEEGPNKAVDSMFTAIEDKDCEAFKEVVDVESEPGFTCPTFDLVMSELNRNYTIAHTIKETTVDGDTASVEVEVKGEPKNSFSKSKSNTVTFQLKKQDDKWKIKDTDGSSGGMFN